MTTTCVIMSYQYGHLVANAIESVLGQTKPFDKVIAIDDGAHDFYGLVEKYPEVQIVQRGQNMGIVDGFNDALNKVDTDYVLFLGADNWLHPETLEKLTQADADIISYDAWIWGDGHNELWHLPHQPHGSALYNVKKAKEVGGYADSGKQHTEEDSVMFGNMRQAGATFAHVSEPLLYYRRHRSNFNK